MYKLLSLLCLALPLAAAQSTAQPPSGITVTATGTAYGEPDEASFDAGVSALSADVQAATTRVNERVSSLIQALRDAGVAERDVRTSNFSVYPEPIYSPSGQVRRMRYRVANTVSVTVRNITQLGELLGRSVQSGANEIYTVVYIFSDRTALERRAREKAMESARENAAQLASLGGTQLGEVRRIVEGTNLPQPFEDIPFAAPRDLAQNAGLEVPVSGGQLAVTVTVQVTFSLE